MALLPPTFTAHHIVEGEKLASKLLRDLQREDPRVGLIAVGMCAVFALRATRVRLSMFTDLLQNMGGVLDGVQGAAQNAISSLITL